MRCPHCDVGIHELFQKHQPFIITNESWVSSYQKCPECKGTIIKLAANWVAPQGQVGPVIVPVFIAFPRNASARPVPAGVPDPYKQDFEEAVAVLPISAKASAALSRRNLQAIIRDKAGIKGKDLNVEIQTVIDSGKVPSYIADGLHAVRQIGNFAAHPIKSTSTGEIVNVEDGEAEWNLDILESLFDFYFIQPAITAARKTKLNKKLTDSGKPTI
jgi:hypothetical protein